MRAMDYISSTNICYLVCDTLSLIDKRPIDHGIRVAYMLLKLLECKGGYDDYEIAEFVFLAMIHDIGAYRTEKLSDELLYDGEEAANAHSVYGALFLKNVSPFGERSDIIMYHHLPYSKLSGMSFEYRKIAMYLSLLEDVDALYRRDGADLDYHSFEAGAGSRYYSEAVMLLLKCIRGEGMMERIATGEYKQEIWECLDNVLFTNEEKENYIRFIMHCYSLKGRMRTVEAVMCCCIVDEIAENMELTGREKDKLYYAAMLHDVGMIALDKEMLKLTKETADSESDALRGHVEIGRELLEKYFDIQDITEIAAAHHERMDGSGYPNRLKENAMTSLQLILQAADAMVPLLNKKKSDGKPLSQDEVVNYLLKQVENRKLSKKAVRSIVERYEKIDKRIQSETRSFLEMHIRINNRYKMLVDSNVGEEV